MCSIVKTPPDGASERQVIKWLQIMTLQAQKNIKVGNSESLMSFIQVETMQRHKRLNQSGTYRSFLSRSHFCTLSTHLSSEA